MAVVRIPELNRTIEGAEPIREFARNDGPLGAGVDDEAIGAAAADADRNGHSLGTVDREIERLDPLDLRLCGDWCGCGSRILRSNRRRKDEDGDEPKRDRRSHFISPAHRENGSLLQ